ncbi:hypothetical protein L6164_000892 [Bauhinia variegata]|uniref:Uncharacterized protein n=1 Tax=Bauhinia variegata TaxID=167791 RepID=A0ACB9Q8H3_BAUVA|nr:hypothetical protein L6164_000892 [Bauhinia variegata]
MDKHENRFKDENEKVKRWKSALNEAANLSGSTYRTGYEFEFITKIIEDTSTKLHQMHDLIQDMGKEVVKQDASSKLGEYSRLWNHEDIVDVLTTNSNFENLDRLEYLDVDNCKKLRQFSRVPPNLKILQLDGCMSSQSLNSILSQALQAAKPFQVSMSRIDIPDCFDHRCKGGRLSFWARVKYVHKFNFAAVFKISSKISSQSNGVMHMDIYRYNNGIETSIWGRSYFSNESGIIILWLSDYSNIKIHDWNHVEIKCRSLSPYYEIDECGVYMCKKDMNMEDIQFECPIPSNSNMDTVMSKNDEELRDLIDEAKPRKRCRRFMSSNDEKIDEAKRRKMCRRVGSRNGKQREASELPRRRFIKKRIGIHTGWRRKVLAPLLFSKLFKLSSSFHSIGKLKQLLSTDQRQCLC